MQGQRGTFLVQPRADGRSVLRQRRPTPRAFPSRDAEQWLRAGFVPVQMRGSDGFAPSSPVSALGGTLLPAQITTAGESQLRRGLPARIRPRGSPASSSERALRSSPGVLPISIDDRKTLLLKTAGIPPVPHLRSPLGGPPAPFAPFESFAPLASTGGRHPAQRGDADRAGGGVPVAGDRHSVRGPHVPRREHLLRPPLRRHRPA